jgi:homogentisate 1,2-dioxygenase
MNVTPEDDFMDSRKFLMNNDLKMGLSKPRKSMDYFYKNAECDELLYAHSGSGILKTL